MMAFLLVAGIANAQWQTGTGKVYTTTDNVGIGTSTPQQHVDVRGGAFMVTHSTYNDIGVKLHATLFPSVIFQRWTGGASYDNAMIAQFLDASGYYSLGIGLIRNTTAAEPTTRIMTFRHNGSVGIGTDEPGSHKLAVNGSINATEIKVTASIPGPDYVFEKDYNLPNLTEIESYITKNKHLPEVPSAKEMEENGIQLGEMNLLLLKKIEELTLYVIEQQKQVMEQQKQIDELKAKSK